MPPKLIVFDLDFTLWNCGETWCDCLTPPFRIHKGRILDRGGRHVRLYSDVHGILDHCDTERIPFAVASRTEQPGWAAELLNHLQITERFAYSEIYPSSKLKHFAALKGSSGVEYEEMLFFDDEMRNIREVSELGVTCVHVPSGLDGGLFFESLEAFGR